MKEQKKNHLDSKTVTIATGGSHIGSGRIIKNNRKIISQESVMKKHMKKNHSFIHSKSSNILNNDQLLLDFKEKYKKYRYDWIHQPQLCITEKKTNQSMRDEGIRPLCIDIETVAMCDLACPFCFREYYATPDKLIDSNFCFELLDQISELGIPSVKFNWRGEPLLHPKLPDFIAYAKKKGIIETIINTNATNLTEKKAKELISTGLDYMIYSFDGGTKETYEEMRPGRFKENKFEHVYENIRQFKSIRDSTNSPFPYTKIQMILTKETSHEKEQFFDLFSNYVDDVSLSQYSERGGELTDIDDATKESYEQGLIKHGLPEGTPYMRDPQGRLYLSKQRKPCAQPFQRLLITYEGRVAMCCYDWGAAHPVGYVKSEAYQNETDYDKIVERAKNGDKGFELLSNVKKSKIFNQPPEKVQKLKDVWFGEEINRVRNKHISGKVDDVEICKGCTFKDTYKWIPVDHKDESKSLNLPEGLV